MRGSPLKRVDINTRQKYSLYLELVEPMPYHLDTDCLNRPLLDDCQRITGALILASLFLIATLALSSIGGLYVRKFKATGPFYC